MVILRILVHIASRAPPRRHTVPQPNARSAANHPVFKQMALASKDAFLSNRKFQISFSLEEILGRLPL